MNKKMIKGFALLISGVVLATSMVACGDNDNFTRLPDYAVLEKQMDFYGCSSGSDGTFLIDGIEYELGPDMRTVEAYKMYKDTGFNEINMSGTVAMFAPSWEQCELKRCMENAYEAGIEHIRVQDERLWEIAERGKENAGGLVGKSGVYKTYEDLKTYIKGCMKDYIKMPGFYGLIMRDEPTYSYTVTIRYIINAVYDAWEELVQENDLQGPIKDYIEVYQCLLPYSNISSRYCGDGQYDNMNDAYRGYLEGYLRPTIDGVVDENGELVQFKTMSTLTVDVYAPRKNGLSPDYFVSVQALREVCAKYNVQPRFVATSFEMYSGMEMSYRGAYKSEMLLEMYSLIGNGYKKVGYYTYQPSVRENALSEWNEEFNFITRGGEKTNIYYYGQDVMDIAQKTAKITCNYDFLGSKFYFADMPNFDTSSYTTGQTCKFVNTKGESVRDAMRYVNSDEYKHLEDVRLDNDVVYTTELHDVTNDLYMYMLQNAMDPAHGKNGRTAVNITAIFDNQFTHVAVIEDGNIYYQELVDGVYQKTLSAGYAVFVVPLK